MLIIVAEKVSPKFKALISKQMITITKNVWFYPMSSIRYEVIKNIDLLNELNIFSIYWKNLKCDLKFEFSLYNNPKNIDPNFGFFLLTKNLSKKVKRLK